MLGQVKKGEEINKKIGETRHFKSEGYTIALVDNDVNKYFLVSAFCEADGSAYLIINSGVGFNYAKFSFHPKDRRFHFGFTDEVWSALDRAGKGRPNKEKIKSKIVDLPANSLLCDIHIDKSSLFRKGIPSDRELKFDFPENKYFRVSFSLENNIPVISQGFFEIDDSWSSKVQEERARIYTKNHKFKTADINGVVQLMDDHEFPWKMLCIGV